MSIYKPSYTNNRNFLTLHQRSQAPNICLLVQVITYRKENTLTPRLKMPHISRYYIRGSDIYIYIKIPLSPSWWCFIEPGSNIRHTRGEHTVMFQRQEFCVQPVSATFIIQSGKSGETQFWNLASPHLTMWPRILKKMPRNRQRASLKSAAWQEQGCRTQVQAGWREQVALP